jgi:hypothetical protein
MINLQFNIRVPGSDRFRNIVCWSGSTPFKNKFWEVQCYKSADIIDLFLRITAKQDHAGIHAGIGFIGFNIEIQIYDSRHWDKEIKSWKM